MDDLWKVDDLRKEIRFLGLYTLIQNVWIAALAGRVQSTTDGIISVLKALNHLMEILSTILT